MLDAGELCNREVVIADPDESILEAARRMRDHHVGSLIVVEGAPGRRRPIGVVTDRDIVACVVLALAFVAPWLIRKLVGRRAPAPPRA
jgi:CBS domain-containing protein